MVRALILWLLATPTFAAAQAFTFMPNVSDSEPAAAHSPPLGEWGFGRLCVVTPNQPKPDCAKPVQGPLTVDIAALQQANADDPGAEDLTCRRIPEVRQTSRGMERTWTTVCGEFEVPGARSTMVNSAPDERPAFARRLP